MIYILISPQPKVEEAQNTTIPAYHSTVQQCPPMIYILLDPQPKVEEAKNTKIPAYHSTRVQQNNSTIVSPHDLYSS